MNLKAFANIISVGLAIVALGISGASQSSSAAASANGAAVPLAPLKFTKVSRGQIAMTAAINADGTVAKCYLCKPAATLHLGTGQYQVGFTGSVKASAGVSRFVRADTLSAGSTKVWCDTADRAGVASAIFVNCQTASGPADTSFFLFIAK
jgi:hypothetical protein